MDRYYAALAAAMVVLSAGCASTKSKTDPSAALSVARARLDADIKECTQRFGYDPARPAEIPEHALAPNEMEWRECVHQALTPYSTANPAMSAQYDALIANDIAMTTAIAQGIMTRSQRKARLEQLVAQIKSEEDQLIGAYQTQQKIKAQEMENTISAIRALTW